MQKEMIMDLLNTISKLEVLKIINDNNAIRSAKRLSQLMANMSYNERIKYINELRK